MPAFFYNSNLEKQKAKLIGASGTPQTPKMPMLPSKDLTGLPLLWPTAQSAIFRDSSLAFLVLRY